MFDRIVDRIQGGRKAVVGRAANSRRLAGPIRASLCLERLEPRMLLSGFTAYNDTVAGPVTHSNATVYTDNGGTASGQLKDIETGDYTSVHLSTVAVGIHFGGTGTGPAAGTDAGMMFGPYIDFTSSWGGNSVELDPGDSYTYQFSNLDPGDTYEFAGTAVRGSDSYDDRWTLITLSGADLFTPDHSTGIGVVTSGLAPNQVALWTGANHRSDQGFIAQWTDIDPGQDGTLEVACVQYTGPTPGVGNGTANGSKGYGLNAIRLIENVPSSPPSVVNAPATNIEAFAAELNGEITNTGGQAPNVVIYYGDEDAGTAAGNWDHLVNLGAQTRTFSEVVTGLNQATTYYFRAYAENTIGSAWAPDTQSFTTLTASLPAVVNLPAMNVGAVSAWLPGEVTDTGNDPPLVRIYYGAVDGGTDSGAWDDSIDLDMQTGTFVGVAEDLEPTTTYYYTAYAQNAVGGSWATPSLSFETTEPPPLQITEFMADNATVLLTRTRASAGDPFLGDSTSPDWIEIHNPTDAVAVLGGLYLTDDLADPTQWAFPTGTSIEPGGFLVVFASGENITDPDLDENGYLHTNFKLQDDGEDLGLADAAGTVMFSFEDYPVQTEDVSYGVGNDGQERFFTSPTPGWDNANEFPMAPEFSVASTTFTGSIALDLIPRFPTDTIHYTLDESVPTAASPTYVGTLTISNTTMVRAISVGTTGHLSLVVSESYVELGSDMLDDNTNLPIVVVETFGDGVPGTGTYFGDCFIAVIEPGTDGRSRLTDPFVESTRGGIHIRGSSSAGFYKKQYRVELWDESNEDRKLPILGMPSEADWIFYGPGQYDRALISNPLIFDLSNQIGRYAVRTRWVEMYLNSGGGQLSGSDYYGAYAIMEVIERGDDRVDVERLSSGAGGVPVQGGFIWRKDRGSAYVEPENPNSYQSSYINGYLNNLEAAATGPNFTDPDLGYAAWADVGSFIDHNLLNMLAMNVDAMRLSGYYYKTEEGKLEAGPIWDFDRALESTDGRDDNPSRWNGTGDSTLYFNDGSRVKLWWPRMFQDPDFVQKYIDRWFELREDEFSLANIYATIDAHAADLQEAAPRDYARWYNPRFGGFAGEMQHMKDWLTTRINWVDSQWLARPTFSIPGPVVTPGTTVMLSSPVGTVYYTLDGSDPRAPGGGIAGIPATGPITVNEYTQITARVYRANHGPTNQGYIPSGDDWSAPAVGEYFVNPLVGPGDVVITEINYHPLDATPEELASQPPADPDFQSNDFEFIELQNLSGQTVNIRGVSFTVGFDFTFGSHVLADGELIVVAEDPEGFVARYGIDGSLDGTGITLAGTWKGELSNKGEQVTLVARDGATLLNFAYDDSGAWPNRADGGGSSLELRDPSAVPSTLPESTAYLEDPANWRSSVDFHGSPGAAGSEPSVTVLVNEVLAHSDLPFYDTIELYNAGNDPIDIAGWYLSDSNDNCLKFAIPPNPVQGTTHWLPSGGYAVFDEWDFNATRLDPDPNNDDPNDFALSGFGDDVWLVSVDDRGKPDQFVDRVEFEATLTNVSVGRLPNGNPDSDLLPLASSSFAAPNLAHRVGEAIVSEVHYNPDGPDAGREFIELYNNTGALLDLGYWRIADAVDVQIPAETTLAVAEALALVDFDPDVDVAEANAFRAEYRIGTDVQLIGPWDSEDNLDNGGEKITLQRRNDEIEPGETQYAYIAIDQVDFDDEPPWPDADANGNSLTRLAAEQFGNDPAGWTAATPTPGSAFLPPWSEVVGRHVFYNDSLFDGNDPTPGGQDDDAIAPDKQALLPGQTATFANYTSYVRGINGIMVDVVGMRQGALPGVDDFRFRVGNNNDPDTWVAPPATPTITVRPRQGVDGSDRVTIVWPDNAIHKQWLQVTVLTTDTTRLAEEDVFFFGNAIAESGNSTTDAKVNAFDMLGARDNQRTFLNPAPIDFAHDFNRDARVNTYDMLIARDNQTHFLNALKLITAPMVGQGTCPTIAREGKATGQDAAEVRREAAYDAVLAETFALEPGNRHTLPCKMDWLFDVIDLSGGRSTSRKPEEPGKDRSLGILLP